MIVVTTEAKPTRECTAPYEHKVNGKFVTTEIRVSYYSWTTGEIKRRKEKEAAKEREFDAANSVDKVASLMNDLIETDGKPKKLSIEYLDSLKEPWTEIVNRRSSVDDTIYYSETLAERLESLPDLVGKDKKPVKISVEFLDTLDIRNLEAIAKAIEEDIRPKAQPQT